MTAGASKSVRVAAAAATALLLAAWFLRHAGGGLFAWFSGDDLMNLHGAVQASWGKLAFDNLYFFGPEIRPLGTLWYRVLYAVAGFRPLPFHAAAFALLFANIALAWTVARRLTGRAETATLAALLVAYNARFANLYFDTGAIYDVLCFTFYYATLACYLRIRARGGFPGRGASALLVVLTVCALNSKEMAVTLPATLLAYELLWHTPSPRLFGAWLLREGRGSLIVSAPVALFVAGKLLAPGSIVHQAGYRTAFTLERALSNAGSYCDDVLYQYGWFTPTRTLVVLGAMLAVALAARSRPLLYAWLLLGLTLTPMLIVDPRGGSAIYICLFGWALYAASALVAATDPLRRFLPPPAKAAAIVLLAALLLDRPHRREGRFTHASATDSGNRWRPTWQALRTALPALPKGARLLFLRDPIEADSFDLLYLVRLGYHDRDAEVTRARFASPPPDARAFDLVLDYADGAFAVTQSQALPARPERSLTPVGK